jgi:hypothetical protein
MACCRGRCLLLDDLREGSSTTLVLRCTDTRLRQIQPQTTRCDSVSLFNRRAMNGPARGKTTLICDHIIISDSSLYAVQYLYLACTSTGTQTRWLGYAKGCTSTAYSTVGSLVGPREGHIVICPPCDLCFVEAQSRMSSFWSH